MGILVGPVNKFRRIIIGMNLVHVFAIRPKMKNFQPQKTSQFSSEENSVDRWPPAVHHFDTALDHEEVAQVEVIGRVNSLGVVFFQQWVSIWVMCIFLDELDRLVIEEGVELLGLVLVEIWMGPGGDVVLRMGG